MFDTESEAHIVSKVRAVGIEPAILLAVAEIESGGAAFSIVDGRCEPLIRFEGHYFDRRLSGTKREQARVAGLAAPSAGKIANPRNQAARWKMLERACAIDSDAAYESVSWGIGQVMGAHWKWLGYPSVRALAEECRKDVGGQIALMLRYIDKANLLPALRNRDWKAFARGYNGPAYAANRYDVKLAEAYRRHARRLAERAIEAQPVERPPSVEVPATAGTIDASRPPLLRWLFRRLLPRIIAGR